MNESINDEAVYRTAPATPGLLKIIHNVKNKLKEKEEEKVLKITKERIYSIYTYKLWTKQNTSWFKSRDK